MAGPYTAFTYGDPKVSPATITGVVSLVGYTPSGNPYPVPLDLELPHAVIGSAYSTTMTAAGGASPYTYAVTSGTLPSGLSLAGSTGVISGTPTGSAGTSTFGITVTDAHGVTGVETFNIVTASAAVTASNYAYAL